MTSATVDSFDRRDVARARDVLDFLPGLPAIARQVGALLLRHLNQQTGRCDPGIDRMATFLNCSRASIFRALDQLEKRKLIDRDRHAGTFRTNAYRPCWAVLRRCADQLDFALKSGAAAAADATANDTTVSSVRPGSSHPCDSNRLTGATQTPERTPEEKTLEEKKEGAAGELRTSSPSQTVQGLPRKEGTRAVAPSPDPQRSFMLPIDGGRIRMVQTTSVVVARQKAAGRLWDDLRRLLPDNAHYAAVLEAMTPYDEETGIAAEMESRGSGAVRLIEAMRSANKGGGDGARIAA